MVECCGETGLVHTGTGDRCTDPPRLSAGRPIHGIHIYTNSLFRTSLPDSWLRVTAALAAALILAQGVLRESDNSPRTSLFVGIVDARNTLLLPLQFLEILRQRRRRDIYLLRVTPYRVQVCRERLTENILWGAPLCLSVERGLTCHLPIYPSKHEES